MVYKLYDLYFSLSLLGLLDNEGCNFLLLLSVEILLLFQAYFRFC